MGKLVVFMMIGLWVLSFPTLAARNVSLDYPLMSQKVDVFGVKLWATKNVKPSKLLHAANVMAQYLDNDADGKVDNISVVASMVDGQASMVLFADEKEQDLFFEAISGSRLERSLDDGSVMLQNLFAFEIHPNSLVQPFDATLEEVLHLITHAGYANALPQVFGEMGSTNLTRAMDKARGGHFKDIPAAYPSRAWYSYDDKTCDYSCMSTEYFYWSLTSLLGAQKARFDDIGHEWRLNTAAKMRKDLLMYALLKDPQWHLPNTLPNGRYRINKLTIAPVVR